MCSALTNVLWRKQKMRWSTTTLLWGQILLLVRYVPRRAKLLATEMKTRSCYSDVSQFHFSCSRSLCALRLLSFAQRTKRRKAVPPGALQPCQCRRQKTPWLHWDLICWLVSVLSRCTLTLYLPYVQNNFLQRSLYTSK